MCTLFESGDAFEKRFYPLFIETRFPSYERFWQREAFPITNREPPYFKTDEELEGLGKSPLNQYLAQLHYSVLFHLGTAYLYVLKADSEMEYTQLTHAMTAIVAAQDVAFELLTWWNQKGSWSMILQKCRMTAATANKLLMSCFEEKARSWAKDWRRKIKDSHPDIYDIAQYRNAMVHRGVRAVWPINDMFWFPKVSREHKYCDWRSAPANEDYAPASGVLWPSWKRTADYFEEQWQTVLLRVDE